MKKRRKKPEHLAILWIVSLILVVLILYSADFPTDIAGKATQFTAAEVVPCPQDAVCHGYIVELKSEAVLENVEVKAIEEQIAAEKVEATGDIVGKAVAKGMTEEELLQLKEAKIRELEGRKTDKIRSEKLEKVQEQQDVRRKLEQKGVPAEKIKNSLQLAVNAIVVDEVDATALEKIKQTPEVKRIYPNVEVKAVEQIAPVYTTPARILLSDDIKIESRLPVQFVKESAHMQQEQDILVSGDVNTLLTESVDLIGASSPGGAWEQGYTGQRVTIGIIDTGVDYTHTDLGGNTQDTGELRGTKASTGGDRSLARGIDQNWIAYVKYVGRNSDVYVFNIDNGATHQITNDMYFQEFLTIDGHILVWDDQRLGNSDIFSYDLSTLQETQLTNDVASQTAPTISGNRIVWMDNRNGNWELYMYDLATRQTTRVTNDPAMYNGNPKLSGDTLVWLCRMNNGPPEVAWYSSICIKNIVTNEFTKIIHLPDEYIEYISISGGKVAWISAGGSIYVYNVETREQARIGDSTAAKSQIKTSGNNIIWRDTRNGNPNIYRYNLLTGQEQPITCDIFDQQAIDIDGDLIIWSDGRGADGIQVYYYSLSNAPLTCNLPAAPGTFPNSKVIGGYDFVNNDADPMDDQGHGTHVASTAAGKGDYNSNGVRDAGEFWGVAPDAKIVAYKVLDSGGRGRLANIIAAIERSIDPNQDGDISDHLDIISLSLGGPGNPDDPMSQAIDRAVDNGVVAVVAAGNSGPAERTIGSPGTARKAITVGAVDKNKQIALFSSRGPVMWSDGTVNKPDVVAPGVAICAAQWANWHDERHCADDQHIAISGTSMATPHVAGIAALLLQKNPTWTPRDVKASLKFSSVTLNQPVTSQGSGFTKIDSAIGLTDPLPTAEFKKMTQNGGHMSFEGSAFGGQFSRYILSYTQGGIEYPIVSSNVPVEDDVLFQGFDVALLLNGDILFELKVEDIAGHVVRDVIPLSLKNVVVLNPKNNDVIGKGKPVEIRMTLPATYQLLSVQHKLKSQSTYTNDNVQLIQNGDVLAIWDVTRESVSGLHSIKITVKHTPSNTIQEEYIDDVYVDVALKQGWPIRIDQSDVASGQHTFWNDFQVSVGNVVGDTKKEIIVVYRKEGLSEVNGFYIDIHDTEGNLINQILFGDLGNGEDRFESYYPTLGNIDDDTYDEIIVSYVNWYRISPLGTASLYVFNADGSSVLGFPLELPITGRPQVIVADLDLNGENELIVRTQDFKNYKDAVINVVSANGRVVANWPITYAQGGYIAVANMDTDPSLEVIDVSRYIRFNEHSLTLVFDKILMTVFDQDGTILSQKNILGSEIGTEYLRGISVGDINNDKTAEMIITIASAQPYKNAVHIVNLYGNPLEGWPQLNSVQVSSPPVLADFNGDNLMEILVSGQRQTFMFSHDGKVIQGWPQFSLTNIKKVISVSDINNDQKLDVVAGSADEIYAWNGEGLRLSGYPKPLEQSGPSGVTFVLDDIDLDGKTDIVAASCCDQEYRNDFFYKKRASVYVFDTGSSNFMSWPAYMHDASRTGNHNFDSELGCFPSYDADNDGFGTTIFVQGAAKVCKANDCNDNNNAINPNVQEICDNLDNNCNGAIDDGLSLTPFYADRDNDGYGFISDTTQACRKPTGYIDNSQDCDDSNPLIKPGATTSCGIGACQRNVLNCVNGVAQTCTPGTPTTEICNNIDDDCDGAIDEECPVDLSSKISSMNDPTSYFLQNCPANRVVCGAVRMSPTSFLDVGKFTCCNIRGFSVGAPSSTIAITNPNTDYLCGGDNVACGSGHSVNIMNKIKCCTTTGMSIGTKRLVAQATTGSEITCNSDEVVCGSKTDTAVPYPNKVYCCKAGPPKLPDLVLNVDTASLNNMAFTTFSTTKPLLKLVVSKLNVQNKGSLRANTVVIQARLLLKNKPAQSINTVVASLDPSQSKSVSLDLGRIATKGSYVLEIIVDPKNSIKESDENNNKILKSFTVS